MPYPKFERNCAQGSCVIDRSGGFLAWNDGSIDHIVVEVPTSDGYLTWNGGCFKGVNWVQWRPHVYEAFVGPDNRGSLG